MDIRVLVQRFKDEAFRRAKRVYKSVDRLFRKYVFPYRLWLVFVAAFLALFLRNTDLLLHPQLWAEDGQNFFADAYNSGIDSLQWTYAGFYQTFYRLVALLATNFSLDYLPYIFAWVSILAALLPVVIMWSDEKLLFGSPKRSYLFLVTALYILMPFHAETLGNLSNSGWYLAIASVLVLIRRPETARKWQWFDYTVLIFTGLTGPYSLLLILPALFLRFMNKGDRVLTVKCLILAVCACIQLNALSNFPANMAEGRRSQVHTVIEHKEMPFQIATMRLVIHPLTNYRYSQPELAYADQTYYLGLLLALVAVSAFIRAELRTKAILLFVFISFAVMLFRVISGRLLEHWHTMATSTSGARYIVIPFFGWIVALAVLASQKKGSLAKYAAATLLTAYAVVLPLSYQLEKFPDTHYEQSLEVFNSLKTGEEYCIQENPSEWKMCLIKK